MDAQKDRRNEDLLGRILGDGEEDAPMHAPPPAPRPVLQAQILPYPEEELARLRFAIEFALDDLDDGDAWAANARALLAKALGRKPTRPPPRSEPS